MLLYFNGKYGQVSPLTRIRKNKKIAERHYTWLCIVISVDTVISMCLIWWWCSPLVILQDLHNSFITHSYVWQFNFWRDLLLSSTSSPLYTNLGSGLFYYVPKSFELPISVGVLWLFVFFSCYSNNYYIYLIILISITGSSSAN